MKSGVYGLEVDIYNYGYLIFDVINPKKSNLHKCLRPPELLSSLLDLADACTIPTTNQSSTRRTTRLSIDQVIQSLDTLKATERS